jgi:hypothetical protein
MAGFKHDALVAIEGTTVSSMPEKDSLSYKVWEIEKHLHPAGGTKIVPTNVSTPVTLASGGVANTFGAWVEIDNGSSFPYKFDPNVIYITSVTDAARLYNIEIGKGAGGSEVTIGACIGGKRDTNRDISEIALHSARVNGGTRIAARVKDDEAAVNSVNIFLGYHEYPDAGLNQ